ncbi:MAG TPA: c-type cytochrome [Longimicrobiales bacterium]|nr:c-type cytochrome [Longimicrobiales bacterium]
MSRYSIALLALLVSPLPAAAQIPETLSNLQVFDQDIPRDSLIQIMRGFSFALGVRCEHCHVLGEGGSFQGADFPADDKLPKARARFMLRMVEQLNGPILSGLPMDADSDPPVAIECKTCHRGQPRPVLLHHELQQAYDTGGAAAAEARYRELRANFGDRGAFDFGEWEFTEWARRLASTEDAIALQKVNFEFHPQSASIASLIAGGYEELGDLGQAVAWMERAVEVAPQNRFAAQELERLRGLASEAGG